MANVLKRPESKYFIACWTDPNGRRFKRSTKTTDRKVAEKLARQFEEETRAKRTAKQARKILADVYRGLSGEELTSTTVAEFFDGFVEKKKLEVSDASHSYYKGHSKRFLAWLGPKAKADISDITPALITQYRNHVATQAGTRTTNNTLKAVKTFFAAARKAGFLAEDPAADVDSVRDRSESNRRPFTLEELRLVMARATPEWRSLILFGLYSGQRLGDLASLTWGNVDMAANELRLTTKKTGRRQTLPLAEPLREHLAALPHPDDPKAPLHPSAAAILANEKRSSQLSKQFAGLLVEAGLRKPGSAEGENARVTYELSFHSLRHSATSILKAAGVPASVVMSYIGHSSAAVSQGYTHTDKESLEKAAAVFPKL